MGHAWMWRTGLILLVLLWGCEERKPTTELRTPSSGEARQPMTSESPTPGRVDTHEDSAETGVDPTPGWSPIEAAGIPNSVLSPDGRFALVVSGGERVRHIDIYDAPKQRRVTRITLDDDVVVRTTNADVRWTAGNHILLRWSAGSDVANGVVYGTDGKILLDLSSPGMVLSPSRRYLATFPTLFAAEPLIEVYDLSVGRRVAERAAGEGTFWVVDDLEWKGRQLVAFCRALKDQKQEVRIALDAQP